MNTKIDTEAVVAIQAFIHDATHIDPVAYQAFWDELDRLFPGTPPQSIEK